VSDGDNELCGQVAAIEPAAVFISRHVGEGAACGKGLHYGQRLRIPERR